MILVDTSVWIDFLRGVNSPERQTLHRLIEGEEMLQGINGKGLFFIEPC
ncbi:MAG: hypothetical protein HY805_05240 [Nitrospirae bacterium]|nr:hypothetical protein [Nitrospirota bacterium]